MKTIFVFLVLAGFTAGSVIPGLMSKKRLAKREPSSCIGKWLELKDTTTMCQYYDSKNAQNCGVSEAEKQEILDVHNRLRAGVQPAAKNMMKMYWNDDLADLAQKWAKQCKSAHDTNENRYIPGTGKVFIGQSWASGGLYNDWRAAIEVGWYSEVADFTYGKDTHYGVVGHYTQVVRDEANLIGCGKCSCPSGPVYICNYFRGNSQDKGHPYKSGARGGDCKTKVNGLCDAGTTFCKNNGVLNPKTNQCDCVGKFTGSTCGSCSGEDGPDCQGFFAGKCDIWTNVPEECPHMCGRCNGGSSSGENDVIPPPVTCTDSNTNCPVWASNGECSANPGWMSENCKMSCNTCSNGGNDVNPPPVTCTDSNTDCPYWANNGECSANPIWMSENCKASCNTCNNGGNGVTCTDSNIQCPDWASSGECSANPGWMLNNCKMSCSNC